MQYHFVLNYSWWYVSFSVSIWLRHLHFFFMSMRKSDGTGVADCQSTSRPAVSWISSVTLNSLKAVWKATSHTHKATFITVKTAVSSILRPTDVGHLLQTKTNFFEHHINESSFSNLIDFQLSIATTLLLLYDTQVAAGWR